MEDHKSRVQRSGGDRRTWSNLHDGSGDITVDRYFSGALPWPIEVEMWTLPMGASEGVHFHGDDDPDGYTHTREMYVVVEGECAVTLGDVEQQLGPGDAFFADAATARGVQNTGAGPLRLMVISDPPTNAAG